MIDGMKVLIFIAVVFFVGCSSENKSSEWETVEYIKVSGKCHEDHSYVWGHYQGDFIISRKKTTGEITVYGAVMDESQVEIENILDNSYKPPFMVDFWLLEPQDLQGEQLTLHGEADLSPDGDGSGPISKVTCILNVEKRLDHMPQKLNK